MGLAVSVWEDSHETQISSGEITEQTHSRTSLMLSLFLTLVGDDFNLVFLKLLFNHMLYKYIF